MFYPRRLILLSLILFNAPVWASVFQDNGDGTVTDLATGLIWQQRDDNMFRTHSPARNYCNALSLAGNSNWRLPSIKELSSIVDYRTNNPSIDDKAFPSTNSSAYWSASFNGYRPGLYYFIGFNDGEVKSSLGTTGEAYVRCVR